MSRRRSGVRISWNVNGRANRKKRRSLKRACLPMASVLLVHPGRRFRLSRLKGNYIIRDLTRLRNSIKNKCLKLARARRED
jgi:hypothetical protein